MTVYPFDPPITTNLSCRNCADPIVATGQVVNGGMTIGGLREYRWIHAHGSVVCLPKTTAQPFDGWQATREVEAAQADRRAAEDALIDAMEGA